MGGKWIGFTGHRDKVTDDRFIYEIEEKYPGAVWVHGGAEGFDTQVNSVARTLGKHTKEQLIVLRPDYKNYSAKYAPLVRNKYIVRMTSVLYAMWDGRMQGGTYQTIMYAKNSDCEVVILRPTGWNK